VTWAWFFSPFLFFNCEGAGYLKYQLVFFMSNKFDLIFILLYGSLFVDKKIIKTADF